MTIMETHNINSSVSLYSINKSASVIYRKSSLMCTCNAAVLLLAAAVFVRRCLGKKGRDGSLININTKAYSFRQIRLSNRPKVTCNS